MTPSQRRPLRPEPFQYAVPTLAVLLALALAAPSAAVVADEPGVAWRSNFEAARAEAIAKNQPLWVQFTGPWCVFCRKMERETFAHPQVSGLARGRFVAVKVRSDEREDLVAAFGITGLPSTVVLSTKGAILARRDGFAGPDEFLGLLASVPAPRPTVDTRVALAGYCPVSLMEGRGLAEGQPEFAVKHDGKEYRFARRADRDVFLREPSRFLPDRDGRCVVSLVDRTEGTPGRPEFGASYRGRLYLFADEASRRRFASNPEKYAPREGRFALDRATLDRLVKLPQTIAASIGRQLGLVAESPAATTSARRDDGPGDAVRR